MPSEGGTFAKHKLLHCVVETVSSQGSSACFPRPQFVWWMLKWGKSCPQSWLEVSLTKYGKPKSQPHPNAELHERQWRTNLLHEHGSLSLVNTSNIQHLVPHQSAIPEKSQGPIVKLDNDALTSSLHCYYYLSIFCSKFKYLCLLLLSCDTLPLIEWSSEACKSPPPLPDSQM